MSEEWDGPWSPTIAQGVVNNPRVLHFTFPPDEGDPDYPFPTVIALVGRLDKPTGSSSKADKDQLVLYAHGYIKPEMKKRLQAANETGLMVTITASEVDGCFLAFTPFWNGYNFRSTTINGYAHSLSGEEKWEAMQLLMDDFVPGRWEGTRPTTRAEVDWAAIIRVDINTSKSHVHTRHSLGTEDEKDLEAGAANHYWEGAIPIWRTCGDPIPGPNNKNEVPEHVRRYVETNSDPNEVFSKRIAVDGYHPS
ncbi:hypothetical protein BDV32DRAFT_144666 [Aspergillus pseudonomiae]|uniref:Uncharacterized protein n=1 Tax=Aspergillus pseudonomiae TaxID=1506151 RepID=A0A5N6IGA8_9EURO|nr:uncharacterized protein BDV37DRAFT_284734 [Aspergillus pseudonomiae]KAB8265376.1 hypothetical protein BDV32DRAFT_144666 [Aspergillus pseudonomiae]KAE8402421.1 hypothetical protein BDV37DRAFT_284734 [Aspergillus pseudonomiae]